MCERNECTNSIIGRNPLKIGVCGSRSCTNKILIFEDLAILTTPLKVKELQYNAEIISGGTKEPDTFAEKYASVCNIPTKIFLPDRDTHGKAAGFIRNKQIVDYSDMVLAFWDQKSKGTKHTIDLALKAGKSVWIVPTS